jgi:hypothetical protein
MRVPTSDVGYTSATTGRGDHEVHHGHVVALGKNSFELMIMLRVNKCNIRDILLYDAAYVDKYLQTFRRNTQPHLAG